MTAIRLHSSNSWVICFDEYVLPNLSNISDIHCYSFHQTFENTKVKDYAIFFVALHLVFGLFWKNR